MIVVFVVDTSPSMGQPLVDVGSSSRAGRTSGLSRLDLAKMAVESVAKGLNKRVVDHNIQLQQERPVMQKSLHNLGLGYCTPDHFLLMSTGRQHHKVSATAACAAGGRLLVGYGADSDDVRPNGTTETHPHRRNLAVFERELKHLQATVWTSHTSDESALSEASVKATIPFPEDGGGAAGLNISLSTGLQLLSRYRLINRQTENFGLGRLPSSTILAPSGSGAAVYALQPACLILVTDGESLRKPPTEGGGSLELKVGNMPLRDFYREPFRWDQRVFCIGLGAPSGSSSSRHLAPSLRALCDVTGGAHMLLSSTSGLSHMSEMLLKLIAPPRFPEELPIPDPLTLETTISSIVASPTAGRMFVNGGPICCFQALEAGPNGEHAPLNRAMLLYVPSTMQTRESELIESLDSIVFHPPMWCIPESYFPNKTLDTLPPRLGQPLLTFSRSYNVIGSNSFDPTLVMKAMHRLDQLVLSNRRAATSGKSPSPVRLLHRDVYVCDWLSPDGKGVTPRGSHGTFPVFVRGAGRPLTEGEEHFLNIGVLRIPPLSNQATKRQFCTLTLLPPEPHILLPLLLKAAQAEHRAIKRATETNESSDRGGATAGLLHKQSGMSGAKNVHLDEHWRSEFRAYLFRVPVYYHNSIKRCLRPVLPQSAQSLLNIEGIETIASQCFSKACLQKIRTAEQIARDANERLERQEAELRRQSAEPNESSMRKPHEDVARGILNIGYGQYDPRGTTASYLASLRTLPAPWRAGKAPETIRDDEPARKLEMGSQDGRRETASTAKGKAHMTLTAVDILGDLPANCLVPYYESRRRWLFGGSGLTTRGMQVEGVNNDGSNVHRYNAKHSIDDESLLAVAGVGASTLNQTSTLKMGDFRERLLWSRSPVVGYGSNDATGVAATTAADGSAKWSVDDDALPTTFFNPMTGEFADSVETRVRSRLSVNFGNPYRDKRGDSLIPEKYVNQSPAHQRLDRVSVEHGSRTPPASPPHDAFVEGEGEAMFAEQSSRKSPPHLDRLEKFPVRSDSKRQREDMSPPETSEDPKMPPAKRSNTDEQKLSKARSRPPPPKGAQRKQPPPPPRPPPRAPHERVPSELGNVEGSSIEKTKLVPETNQARGPEKISKAPPSAPSSVQQMEEKPKVDLPQGWMCVWSKSQKRWYFFNRKTNKSVWEWPPPGVA